MPTLAASILHAVYSLMGEVLAPAGPSPYLAALHQLVQMAHSAERTPTMTLLAVLTCRAAGGPADQAVPLAAAWRLLHLAAKLLDDVEDGDPPLSLSPHLSASQAINLGVGLLCGARRALAHLRRLGAQADLCATLADDFERTVLAVCAGQHEDLMEAGVAPDTPGEDPLQRYRRLAAAKTGACFALPCRVGALLATGDPACAAPYATFGHHLGRLIQLSDDFNGIWRPEGRSDLAAGKRTWPILYALAVAPPEQRAHLERLLAQAPADAEAEGAARRWLTDLGAAAYLMVESRWQQQRAALALQATGRISPAHRELQALLATALLSSVEMENVR